MKRFADRRKNRFSGLWHTQIKPTSFPKMFHVHMHIGNRAEPRAKMTCCALQLAEHRLSHDIPSSSRKQCSIRGFATWLVQGCGQAGRQCCARMRKMRFKPSAQNRLEAVHLYLPQQMCHSLGFLTCANLCSMLQKPQTQEKKCLSFKQIEFRQRANIILY